MGTYLKIVSQNGSLATIKEFKSKNPRFSNNLVTWIELDRVLKFCRSQIFFTDISFSDKKQTKTNKTKPANI